MITWFLFGDLIRIFGILRFDAVFINSWLEFWNETGDFLLFLLNRFGFLEFFFPSSSQSSHCDRTEFVASGDEFSAWIAESKAQWWRFKLESLRAHTNSMVLAWIWFLETVRVLWIVLDEFCFDLNCQERECGFC